MKREVVILSRGAKQKTCSKLHPTLGDLCLMDLLALYFFCLSPMMLLVQSNSG